MNSIKSLLPRIGITIRFRDREQVDLIKRAARASRVSFNQFVARCAEMYANEVEDSPYSPLHRLFWFGRDIEKQSGNVSETFRETDREA